MKKKYQAILYGIIVIVIRSIAQMLNYKGITDKTSQLIEQYGGSGISDRYGNICTTTTYRDWDNTCDFSIYQPIVPVVRGQDEKVSYQCAQLFDEAVSIKKYGDKKAEIMPVLDEFYENTCANNLDYWLLYTEFREIATNNNEYMKTWENISDGTLACPDKYKMKDGECNMILRYNLVIRN